VPFDPTIIINGTTPSYKIIRDAQCPLDKNIRTKIGLFAILLSSKHTISPIKKANPMLTSDQIRPDPNNPYLTIPRSFGVWAVPSANGKKFRYGNNPVREYELDREFGKGKVTRIGLFERRELAKAKADSLNHH
jgi:hypothetical protein